MRHRADSRGFTIIETLIFLSISAFVFIAAIGQYSSQQKAVEFSHGVRNMQSMLDSMINEVSTSYAPDMTGYRCLAQNNNSSLTVTPTTVPVDNSTCVFLGKAIGVGHDSACTTNTELCSRYSIIPIIARKDFFVPASSTNKRPVNSLAEAKPLALATCLTNDDGANSIPCGSPGSTRSGGPDMAERERFSSGIGVYKAFVRSGNNGGVQREIGAIAFTLSLNRTGSDATNDVDLVWLDTNFANNTESRVTDAIYRLGAITDPAIEASYTNPEFGVTFCIVGAFGQKSAIVVGGNRSQLDVLVRGDEVGC